MQQSLFGKKLICDIKIDEGEMFWPDWPCGLNRPDASYSGVGRKGLASAFFLPFYLATEQYLGPFQEWNFRLADSRLFDKFSIPTELTA